MEFTIRNMARDDLQQVQKVAKTSWNVTYDGIIPLEIQESFLQSAYNHEMLLKRLENSYIWVSEIDGIVVGFANFSPVNKNGETELSAIYLMPEYQGKGIGTALLNQGINHLKGVKEIFINVERDNKIGSAFYQAKGFNVVHEFDEDFEGHLLKTVRMVLKR